MSESVTTIGVFIGRFQPLHNGHIAVIEQMRAEVDVPVILIGSADAARSVLNPFTYEERWNMLRAKVVTPLIIKGLVDFKYQDNLWLANVKQVIESIKATFTKDGIRCKVVIYGFHKDEGAMYLDWFPEYQYREVHTGIVLDATDIRGPYFEYTNNGDGWDMDDWEQSMDIGTVEILRNFAKTDDFKRLQSEYFYIKQYKRDSEFKNLPYAPIFVAVDAVVICGANVLLIRRGGRLGNNLLAVPGGFLNANETIYNGIFRELKEETKIDVPPAILRNSLKGMEVFDDPHRSLRGRTITHAGLIVLNEKVLPKIKGSDDAKEAFWCPINELENMKNQFFEDHYFIIQRMLSKLN